MYASGVLGRPDEYFNVVITHELHPGARDSPSEQLALTWRDGVTPNGVLAIKFMPYQFDRFRSALPLSVFPDVRWVFIRRKNIVDQAISRVIAMQTDAWYWKSSPICEPTYSADEINSAIDTIAQEERDWLLWFESEAVMPLTLWYDEIAKSPEVAARRVAEHVGVHWPTQLERWTTRARRSLNKERYKYSEMRPQATSRNSEWRTRFAADRPCTVGDLVTKERFPPP